MKNCIHLFILLLGFGYSARSQTPPLDQYIQLGLTSNLTLQQKQLQVEKARLALKEARGLFLPNVNFQADYTLANGGRKIDLPVGDLLNPVYSTLNALTQTQAFPQISNVSEQFLPNNFHDTRFRMTVPVVNTEIWYLQKIRKAGITENEAQLLVYRRDLVRDIKVAYYTFLKADQAIRIYQQAIALQEENVSLTQQLIKNDKQIPSAELQLQADLSTTRAKLETAQNDRSKAAAYLNFLINRPLNTEVLADTSLLQSVYQLPSAKPREELLQLQSGKEQLRLNAQLKKLNWAPTLGVFVDAGYQGFGYTFDSDQDYVLGGFSLKWNLFGGFQQQNRRKIAVNELQNLESKSSEIEKQLQLQLFTTEKDLGSARSTAMAQRESVIFTDEVYRVTQVRFRDGQAIPIELSQALFQRTQSNLLYSISLLDVKIAEAAVERAAASFQFDK